MLEKLVKSLAQYLGVSSETELDAEGAFVFPVGEKTRVRAYQNADNNIVLMVSFGTLAASADQAKAHLEMMVGNLFGRETGGAALGLDPEENVVFVKKFPGDISYEDFVRGVESFVNYSESWRDSLSLAKSG
ncbi:type III secretion system chaperone [Chlamydiifrater phoenicopteri]|uniref:type III secretion system chaperone n=1 Tax=Chlamydiifrater phoenicopteri TaxID=2681469 RepID=UPI001BCC9382|nr:type III secretion system chaperone [Chlamydiifrater phoenicopteri]